MPLRLGASGSVRASSRHQSACIPPLAHSFWPLTMYSSPSRRAVVRRLARSDPASGSEKPCTQISPSRIAGRCRLRCSSVPATSKCRRGMVDADEREDEAGRIVCGQLLVQHDLFGRPTCRRPTRGASAVRRSRRCAVRRTTPSGSGRTPRRRRRFAPPASLSGCARRTIRAHAAEISSFGGHAYSPVRPPLPARRVSSSRVADRPSGSRRRGWL